MKTIFNQRNPWKYFSPEEELEECSRGLGPVNCKLMDPIRNF